MKLINLIIATLMLSSCAMQSTDTKRIKLNGEMFPKTILQSKDATDVKVSDIISKKPSVIVFYRGGWCPYCSKQLSGLRKIMDKVDKLGYQIIAISPDSPKSMKEYLDKRKSKEKLNYDLYSDSNLDLASALGISFKIDDKLYQKYLGYGINLEMASGKTHHSLPMPAVYIVDTKGLIHFSYINPNYKVRLNSEVLLSALKNLDLK